MEEIPADFGPSVLTIGNFDGVHAGHGAIMRQVVAIGTANGWKPSVLTFEPHPARLIAPTRAPRILTPHPRRAALLGELGIEQILILPFSEEVSRWSPDTFVKDLLVDRLKVRALLVGEDFRFGYKQAGDVNLLREMGNQLGFEFHAVELRQIRGARASSTRVRQLVTSGHVARVRPLLGRPFSLEGDVVRGHGIGSKQTVPTLNLNPDSEVLPSPGVYVTRTRDLATQRKWNSVTNVGYRPTFDGDSLTVETFLLQPLETATPQRIRVEFLWRVREEKKFESAEQLKAQIMRDVTRAQAYFRRVERWAPPTDPVT